MNRWGRFLLFDHVEVRSYNINMHNKGLDIIQEFKDYKKNQNVYSYRESICKYPQNVTLNFHIMIFQRITKYIWVCAKLGNKQLSLVY